VGVSEYVHHHDTYCLPDWADQSNAGHGYAIYVFVWITILATLIIVCYSAIYCIARSTFTKVRRQLSQDTRAEQSRLGRRMVTLVITFGVLTTPYKLIIFYQMLTGKKASTALEGAFICMLSLDSLANPMLYPLIDPRYRAIMRKMLPTFIYRGIFWWLAGSDEDNNSSNKGGSSDAKPPVNLSGDVAKQRSAPIGVGVTPTASPNEDHSKSSDSPIHPGVHLAIEASVTSSPSLTLSQTHHVPVVDDVDLSVMRGPAPSVLVVHTLSH